MVRLKEPRSKKDINGIFGFNSLMVRLKVTEIECLKQLAIKFQFLDGAIKSPHAFLLTGGTGWFQFLDGAIKRI